MAYSTGDFNRERLLLAVDRAKAVVELRYFPIKAAFLVLFVVSTLTLDAVRGVQVGIVTWLILSLIMRRPVVHRLCGTHFATFVGLLGPPLRWLVEVAGVVYMWVVSPGDGGDGWAILVIALSLDILTYFIFETTTVSTLRKEKELLADLPHSFQWEDVEDSAHLMPITSLSQASATTWTDGATAKEAEMDRRNTG